MTTWMDGFVPDDGQLIRRTMGETLAQMVRNRWPHNTAKHVARAWDLDPTTAKNLTKGHASERTLTKAIRAEGFELLDALGHALTGQTHHEWEEQKLNRIIEEANNAASNAQERVRRLHSRRALLAEEAGTVGEADAGPHADPARSAPPRKIRNAG